MKGNTPLPLPLNPPLQEPFAPEVLQPCPPEPQSEVIQWLLQTVQRLGWSILGVAFPDATIIRDGRAYEVEIEYRAKDTGQIVYGCQVWWSELEE